MNNKLRFAQINLRASSDAQYETELYLQQNQDLTALFVSDPSWYLKRLTQTYRTSTFHWIGKPETSLSGMFINNKLQYSILDISTDRLTSIEVHSPIGNLILISCYLQPTSLEGLEYLDHFLNISQDRNLPIVLCGDFNSHSKLWFCREDNDQGHRITELLFQYNLTLVNQPSPFSMFDNGHGGTSNIDLSIVSDHLQTRCPFWKVCPWSVPSSDHALVYFELSHQSKFESHARINWNKIDWNRLLSKAESHFQHLWILPISSTPGEIDDFLDQLVYALQSVQADMPHKNQTVYSKTWFTDDIKALYHDMCNAKRLSRHLPTEEHKTQYKSAKKRFQLLVKRTNQEQFEKFLSDTEPTNLWASYKRLTFKTKSQKIPPLTQDGTVYYQDIEKAHVLSQHFFPKLVTRTPATPNYDYWKRQETQHQIDDTITYEELWHGILNRPAYKAPGKDGIFNRTLQMTFPYYALSLQACFNCRLTSGYFPVSFKAGNTIPV